MASAPPLSREDSVSSRAAPVPLFPRKITGPLTRGPTTGTTTEEAGSPAPLCLTRTFLFSKRSLASDAVAQLLLFWVMSSPNSHRRVARHFRLEKARLAGQEGALEIVYPGALSLPSPHLYRDMIIFLSCAACTSSPKCLKTYYFRLAEGHTIPEAKNTISDAYKGYESN